MYVCTHSIGHRKGRVIMATRKFDKNQFVCEYSGELISHKEGLTSLMLDAYFSLSDSRASGGNYNVNCGV